MAWSMLGRLDFSKPFLLEDYETVETTEPINPNTFTLKVRDDSMEGKFPEGSIITIEPLLKHQSGDYVIVLNGSAEATFRQIIQNGSEWYLKPENDRYPIRLIEKNFIVIGVVTAMEMKFKHSLR